MRERDRSDSMSPLRRWAVYRVLIIVSFLALGFAVLEKIAHA